MARFIVVKGKGKAQVYETSGPKTEVGRSDEMDLVLPDPSVSRHHARITVGRDGIQLGDVGSQNGVKVNGKRLAREAVQHLQDNDEIQLGEFILVLVGSGERFYKGRFIDYFTAYSPGATDTADLSTYRFSAAELAALERKKGLIMNARVHLAENEKVFWYPEDRPLTIGKKAMVAVGGLLTGAVDAEVNWQDKWHVLKKVGGLGKVTVNEEVTRMHRLRNGDRFKVGNTGFLYLEHPDDGDTGDGK
jgi:predicted component of type VI protein secretion system